MTETIKYQNRIFAIDLARLLAMLMMIQGHTIDATGNPEIIDINAFPWSVWNFLRGITAPVFLFLSGMVHVFANKRTESGHLRPKTIFKRLYLAIGITVIGYLLAFPAHNIWELDLFPYSDILQFTLVNILQLFGVSLIFLLISYVVTRNDRQLKILSLILAVVFLSASYFSPLIDWFEIFPFYIAQYFTKTGGSFFTVFPFSAFLFIGTFFGIKMKEVQLENRIHFIENYVFKAGLLLLSITLILLLINLFYYPYYDFISIYNPFFSVFRLGFVLIGLPIVSFIYRKFERYLNPFSRMSRRALMVYVIHLFIIYGTRYTDGLYHLFPKQLAEFQAISLSFFVLFITLILTYFLDYGLRKIPNASIVFQGLIILYIILVFFI